MNNSTKNMAFFATCPKNLEGLLESELISLGATDLKQTIAGVRFYGDLKLAYTTCLWSRLANRILLPLTTINAVTSKHLYDGIQSIKWLEHMRETDTFVVDFSGVSKEIENSHFGAQKVKDAVVDQIREETGIRPSIDKINPNIRINVYLHKNIATVSIDLSGDSLHRREYRKESGTAPLKENLAAAILYRANWKSAAHDGMPLIDPMCGSGTILIEAAMMAADIAPGLLRKSFGFMHWVQHNQEIWNNILEEAHQRKTTGLANLSSTFTGYDHNQQSIEMANINITSAGLNDYISVKQIQLNDLNSSSIKTDKYGLIITNPPYGTRLGEVEGLKKLYTDFGTLLRNHFLHWKAAMLTGNPDLGKTMGLRSNKQYPLFNGAIPCKLLLFSIEEEHFVSDRART
jgi:23S rRNA (guanine2445-N2)-methyltransferase / 23S rRNA (guanine2069-N7)-methyltransferase